jgi:hypothetical protein
MSTVTDQVRAKVDANLKNTMGVISNLAKKEAEEKAAAEAKAKVGGTFHARQRVAQRDDPDNNAYRQALSNGTAAAHNFLGAVKNPVHPDHEKNLKVFKQSHGMDENNTIADFRARACRDADVGPRELADPGYEQHILRPYKPTGNATATQLAFHHNLATALRCKWDVVGYGGDKDFIEDYCNKYGLTRDDSTVEMRHIQPKP